MWALVYLFLKVESPCKVHSLFIPFLSTVRAASPKFQTYSSFPSVLFFVHFVVVVVVFLRGPLKIGSKEASLFNLNTLQQNEGNCPQRPSGTWQVSMSQREREMETKASPSVTMITA